MKEKIIRIIFSILAGFGFTLLIFLGLGFLLVDGLGVKEEDVLGFIALIMGTIGFGALSTKVYDYLKGNKATKSDERKN